MINVSIQKVLKFETQPDQSFPNLGSENVTCCLANPTNSALLNMVCQGSTCIFSDQPHSQFCCTTNDWQVLSFTDESSTWILPTPDWMKTPLASSLSLLKPSNVKPKKKLFFFNKCEARNTAIQESIVFFFKLKKQLYKHFIVIVSNDNVAIWKVSFVVMKRIVPSALQIELFSCPASNFTVLIPSHSANHSRQLGFFFRVKAVKTHCPLSAQRQTAERHS